MEMVFNKKKLETKLEGWFVLCIIALSSIGVAILGFITAPSHDVNYATYISLATLLLASIAMFLYFMYKYVELSSRIRQEETTYIAHLPEQKYDITSLKALSRTVEGRTIFSYTVGYADTIETIGDCTVFHDVEPDEASYIRFKKDDTTRYNVELHLHVKDI